MVHTHTFFLHTESFTHTSFYIQKFLHTDTFTDRQFYTQTLVHTQIFTHSIFYTQTHRSSHAQTPVYTHKCFYTQTFLNIDTFTHKHVYTQKLLHRHAFAHRSFSHRPFNRIDQLRKKKHQFSTMNQPSFRTLPRTLQNSNFTVICDD